MPLNDPNDPPGKQCGATSVRPVWEGVRGVRGGDNAAHTQRSRVPDWTALFTARPGRDQHGEHAGGRAEGAVGRKIIRLVNFLECYAGYQIFVTLQR